MSNEKDTTYSECAHGSPKCKKCRNVKVIHWISVNDELPQHKQKVLSFTKSGGTCVTIFVDTVKMNQFMDEMGFPKDSISSKKPYGFCSQEVAGNVLNGITHWADIDHLTPVEFLP